MPMVTRKPKESVPVPQAIQTRLEAGGLRRTLATRAVVGLFVASPQRSLNHAQALSLLTARGLDINRVTLYRLLERLAACGVLARFSDDTARTWRFRLADLHEAEVGGGAPSFECDACHQQFRLPNAEASTQAAAARFYQVLAELGHHGVRMDVAIHGTCAGCTPAQLEEARR
ncbi:Fur family transcriptional regulator [Hydrogenophaga sp. PAMC20947]|uniref:Fur family transcriptional regulator n=1 Tax=Hydrogenophaga sp. PAMC20947 TaxID=2565558 RepID=UPI00109DF969|nr:Fur family transcriptional regulator [Hydrogenophaga sp. PAMC20947]QCB46375.1 Fur family transcriptional regulator [Hydrogenophaga sp. PAMC20947]